MDEDLVPQFQVVKLERVGIVKLESNCQLDCENYFLPESLKINSKNYMVNKTFGWEHLFLNEKFLNTLPWSLLNIKELPENLESKKIRQELMDLGNSDILKGPEKEQINLLLSQIDDLEQNMSTVWEFTPAVYSNFTDIFFTSLLLIYAGVLLGFYVTLRRFRLGFIVLSENISEVKQRLIKAEKNKKGAATSSPPSSIKISAMSLLEGETIETNLV